MIGSNQPTSGVELREVGISGSPSFMSSTLYRRLNQNERAQNQVDSNDSEGNGNRGTVKLGRLLTDEWLDGHQVASVMARDLELDMSEELYTAVLETIAKIWSATDTTRLKEAQVSLFKDGLAKLHLWGRDFGNGRLARVLSQSEELRDTVLQIFRRLGRLVCNGEWLCFSVGPITYS